MRVVRIASRSAGVIALALLASACPNVLDSLQGNWTARVLLATPTGVPATDSAAAVTITLTADNHGEVITGTATGLFGTTSEVSGSITGSEVVMVFSVPGNAAAHAGFEGTWEQTSIPGVLHVTNVTSSPRPLRFTRE